MKLFTTVAHGWTRIKDRLAGFKIYAITALACFAVGFLSGIFLPHCNGKKTAPLASVDSRVAKHEVKEHSPLKGLDKEDLKKRFRAISSGIAKDANKEVLATARIEDASGSRTIAAVLDTKTGETQQVEKRPFAELMKSQELAIGWGLMKNGEWARAAKYDVTFARIGPVYGAISAEIFSRPKATDWQVMAWASVRW